MERIDAERLMAANQAINTFWQIAAWIVDYKVSKWAILYALLMYSKNSISGTDAFRAQCHTYQGVPFTRCILSLKAVFCAINTFLFTAKSRCYRPMHEVLAVQSFCLSDSKKVCSPLYSNYTNGLEMHSTSSSTTSVALHLNKYNISGRNADDNDDVKFDIVVDTDVDVDDIDNICNVNGYGLHTGKEYPSHSIRGDWADCTVETLSLSPCSLNCLLFELLGHELQCLCTMLISMITIDATSHVAVQNQLQCIDLLMWHSWDVSNLPL